MTAADAVSGETGLQAAPRVLIVDDEASTRTLLREIVEGVEVRCQVEEAADGDTALRIARGTPPDLLLLGIVLPGSSTSGVLVCQELCKDSQSRVVTVSGNASESVCQACLSMGATECVHKPFLPDQLRAKLAGCLAALI